MGKIDLPSIKIKKIHAVNRLNISTQHSYYRKNRHCWAISVKFAGKTTYTSEGKVHISDPDHIVLLPKGAAYRLNYEELGECFMVEFEADYDGASPSITSYAVSRKHDFVNKAINLERLWTFKKPAYELFCISGMYDLLAKLHETELSGYYSSGKYKVIEPAIKYLEENYADPDLSSEDMARVAGISSVYFRKIFSIVFGQSPMRYLQSVRMEKAKDMLSGDYTPITDIAESVGFKSIYYFSKTFKKVTGYTPTEYARRKQR